MVRTFPCEADFTSSRQITQLFLLYSVNPVKPWINTFSRRLWMYLVIPITDFAK